MSSSFALSRRRFLSNGAVVVTFTMAPSLIAATTQQAHAADSAMQVDSFIAIDREGHVTIFSGKVDIGTGLRTALMQIAAEELNVPVEAVTIVQGDTQLTPDQGPTSGSNSIQIGGMQLRQAAAAAMRVLRSVAAEHFQVSPETLAMRDGVISASDGRSMRIGDLIGGKRFDIAINAGSPEATKPAHDFKIIGQSIPRIDIPDKVTARYTYMHDVRVPGMLHGRVVRPPAIGARLEGVDASSVAHIAGGSVKVVQEKNFLGVVATSEWAAIRAAQELKATWSDWEGLPEQAKLFDFVRDSAIAHDDVTSDVGDPDTALKRDDLQKVEATYDFAIHTHGSIGPSCAIASFENGKLTAWTASQAPHDLRRQLSVMFGLPVDDIHCIFFEGAGCYGRNGHEDAAADAALLSKTVGKPVRVQWMRAEEHGWDPKGPPTLMDLRAAVDAKGTPVAWEGSFFMPEQRPAKKLIVPLLAAGLAELGVHDEVGTGGIAGNSNIPYKIENIRTVAHRLRSTPFRPSWIRSPGRMQNTFANESFIDELAVRAKADPIEFRLRFLDDPRGIEVIKRASTLAEWGTRPQSSTDQDLLSGRGFAYCKYELVRTYVAAIADIEVSKSTGVIRVRKVFVAHDCGQIINPDGLKNQIDGSVIQTVSRVLKEEITFSRSAVTSLDWASYPILTFPDVPEIYYDLIDRPDAPPWGGGEPAAAVIPAAIANAVFNAAQIRLRSVPFKPDKVKAALTSL